jgi:hypothetical protein
MVTKESTLIKYYTCMAITHLVFAKKSNNRKYIKLQIKNALDCLTNLEKL